MKISVNDSKIRVKYNDDCYVFASQTLNLNSLNRADISSIFKNDIKDIEKIKTVIHELKHFIDHISTFWGRSNMLYFNNNVIGENFQIDSYNDYKNKMDIELFTKKRSFSNKMAVKPESGKLYFCVESGISDRSGSRGDIIWVYYNDVCMPSYFPITLVSLLEASSKIQEIGIVYKILGLLNNRDETIVERHIQFEKFRSELFPNNITESISEYNIIFKITSGILRIDDIQVLCMVVDDLVQISLNFQEECVNNLKIPEDLSDKIFEHGIYSANPTFIYLCLLYNMKNSFEKTEKYVISSILECSGIKYADYQKNLEQGLKKLQSDLFESNNEYKKFYTETFEIGLKMNKLINGKIHNTNIKSLIQFVNDNCLIFGDDYYDDDSEDIPFTYRRYQKILDLDS